MALAHHGTVGQAVRRVIAAGVIRRRAQPQPVRDLLAESRLTQAWAAVDSIATYAPSPLPAAYSTTAAHLDPIVFGGCGCRMCREAR